MPDVCQIPHLRTVRASVGDPAVGLMNVVSTASEDATRIRVKRLGWGLLVGATIGSLPLVASKLNGVVLLLVGEILGWPGAILALVLGGWNDRPFTLFVYFLTNLLLYVGLTYFFLSMREKRKRLKQQSSVSIL